MSDPTSRHDNAIDGLRAIAVLAVVIFHVDASLLPGGFSGVDLFFVVSGFVISQSLASRPYDHMGRYLLDFYRRRVLRLLPALLLVLLVTFVVSALLVPRAWRNEQYDQTGLGALFGVGNLVLAWQQGDYFSPGADLNPFLHTWTLGVEEQFYLLFPLLFLVWLRARASRPWVNAILPLLALASLLLAAWQTTASPTSAFYLLPARLWELGAGALLYQAIANRMLAAHWQRWALPGLMLVLVGFLYAGNQPVPFPGAIATVVGTLMLLAAAASATTLQRPNGLLRVLQWPPLAYLGRLSYSLYLWHWPLLVLLRWTYGLHGIALWAYPVVLLALASASYHWVECPLRGMHAARRAHPGKVLLVAMAALGVSTAGAWAITQYSDTLSLSSTRDGYAWRAQRHPPWMPVEPIDAPALAGRNLFVAGDSHAAAYRTMASIAARQFDLQLHVEERGGCGIANLLTPSSAECAPYLQRVLSKIEREARPGDIVLLASLRMQDLRDADWSAGEAAGFNGLQAQRNPADSAAAEREADAVLARLQALQVQVIIDAPMPVFRAAAYRCSDSFNRMNPACAGGLSVPRAQMEAMRAPQMAALDRLAARYPSLHVWDPLPLLCTQQRCAAMQGDQPLFFDQDHLSGHGNRVLLPDFDRLLLDIAGRAAEAPPPDPA
ncbi:acyltransferase family protein [Stenotrophomonas chelatiphaga]|uniref:acyltransferase family protein n=1 Tax=Stenotrophomonas chelatiphaga TaxID=517011 RepID=UPI00289DF078|nr:acyltransferase family protein [Stenotrophomonas chelatiphaga]